MLRNLYNYFTGNIDVTPQSEPSFEPHPSWKRINQERAALEQRDHNHNTPLLQAVSNMDIDACEDLLQRGAYIEGRGNNGFTPLAAAAFLGFIPAVRLFLAHNANLEVMTLGETQRNPMGWAAHEGHAEIVKLLMEAGANPNACDSAGYTPAMLAEVLGHADCLFYLLPAPVAKAPDEFIPMDITQSEDEEDFWLDPVSMDKLESPVTVPSGYTYSRTTLAEWFKQKGNPDTIPCPMTRLPIPVEALSWGRSMKIEEAMSLNLQPPKPNQTAPVERGDLSQSDVRNKRLKFFDQNVSNHVNVDANEKRRMLASQRKM